REAPDTLWIGTSGGLYHWKNGTARRWTTRDGLLTPSIRALHRDLDGTLWVGTLGGGLARLKNGHLANLTTKQGLIDDVISQIVPDDFGRLWLGCNHGIMRVERKELDDAAEGRASSVHAVAFGQNEGMLQEQCSGGYSPTAIKTREGRLLFPTVRGIVEIDAARSLDSPGAIPQASIEELLVDGQSRSPLGRAIIAPGGHHLEVNYTAPSLGGVGQVRFQQRLEPVDENWINVGTRRTAPYVNLRPGQYAFHVTACDNGGVWGTTGASLAFTVLPQYWETGWFRLGTGLLLIALGGASVWTWSRRGMARARERERLAVEMQQLREELAHASRVSTVGQLAASLAHELNKPLGAILANAEAGELFLQ
ncbi:MAG: triple tyrosine motif-containing protein, partial [Verrucomicrobia bacterium]|nr:triple tyrosine motif-containing protein [Verrucomicrobiota bacterium]